MGNRVVVRFTNENPETDVAVYLHWHGSDVKDWLKAAAPIMRKGDKSYAAARFCGFCHGKIEGGLSLGLLAGSDIQDQGDNGIYVVDVRDGTVTQFMMGYDKAWQPVGLARKGRPFRIKMGGF